MAGALTKAGRYQIVSELGRGSMGVVYQGFDPVIGRTVAIKTMLTEGLAPQEFQEFKTRFQREAQAAGVLAHPNIVTVYDFGEDGGVLFLAMEYLEGKSLEKLIEEQTILPIETIIPIFDQVCSALDHAHTHKIVHRDIKPANIMILETGRVKVTDFGIAKMMSMGMTQAGQILGTPNYMSPEQVKGRPVDGRSDIFSLGVILYELVTGEKPFGGQNITTVIYKIINENPIPPRELDATIHMGLSYVISKVLAKNPEERYQTCRELADDLKNYKSLGGAMAPSATVVVKVPPPIQVAPEPAPTTAPRPAAPPPVVPSMPAEQPPVRQVSVQVIPPAKSQPQGSSPWGWVLLTLLIVGALGGGGYYFFVVNKPAVVVSKPDGNTVPPRPKDQPPPPADSQLTINSNVSAAQIRIDGNDSGTTPSTVTLKAGTHQVVISKSGYDDHQESITVQAGENITINAELTQPAGPTGSTSSKKPAPPKYGQLVVNSNVAGAQIKVDGGVVGTTPRTLDLPTGTHQVTVAKSGYDDYMQSITVQGGQSTTIDARLSVPSGEVNIVTTPPGLEVVIDGRSAGASPARATVTVGQHTYQIKRPGLAPYESTFTIKESGSILTKRVDLGGGASAASTGIVDVRTIPPGATVYADGTSVGGQTPTSFSLPAGRHMITISLSGYRPVQETVEVKADGTVQIQKQLSR